MLNFEEFQEHIKNNILSFLPDEYSDATLRFQQVSKNNETLTGLVIQHEHTNVSPNIYIDSFYEDYKNGNADLDSILEAISNIYVKNLPSENFEVGRITDFEQVKDNIIAKIISVENNEKLLEGKPYRAIADLAVTYHVFIGNYEGGQASIPVTNELMNMWGATEDVLFAASKNGMKTHSPVAIKSMTETMIEMMGEEAAELMGLSANIDPADEMIFVLSNSTRLNGAAAIVDPNNMDLARSYIQGDFYILPSSIHEVLLVRAGQMSLNELEAMVQEVNATQVAPQDRLSDHVYKYDFDRHEIYRADQEQQRQAELNASQSRPHVAGR